VVSQHPGAKRISFLAAPPVCEVFWVTGDMLLVLYGSVLRLTVVAADRKTPAEESWGRSAWPAFLRGAQQEDACWGFNVQRGYWACRSRCQLVRAVRPREKVCCGFIHIWRRCAGAIISWSSGGLARRPAPVGNQRADQGEGTSVAHRGVARQQGHWRMGKAHKKTAPTNAIGPVDKLKWTAGLHDLVSERVLKPVDLRVAEFILRHINATGATWLRHDQIASTGTKLAKPLGVSTKTIQRSVGRIHRAGLLDVVFGVGQGNANEYRLPSGNRTPVSGFETLKQDTKPDTGGPETGQLRTSKPDTSVPPTLKTHTQTLTPRPRARPPDGRHAGAPPAAESEPNPKIVAQFNELIAKVGGNLKRMEVASRHEDAKERLQARDLNGHAVTAASSAATADVQQQQQGR
jgi:hypothetical protein